MDDSRALPLIVYLLSYSSGFAAVAVCLFALRKGAPAWLWRFVAWTAASLFFLLLRNGGLFAKRFLGAADVEHGLPFYVCYLASCGLFVFWTAVCAATLARAEAKGPPWRAAAVLAAPPLLSLALLLPSLDATGGLRAASLNLFMYYCYAAVAAAVAYVAAGYRRIGDRLRRSLAGAYLAAGAAYLLLCGVQWLGYRAEEYSLEPFSMVNVSLFLCFLLQTAAVGRRCLLPAAHDAAAPEAEAADYPGLTDQERRMVLLVKQGATNQEIAAALGISLAMVKNRLFRLYGRFGVNSRIELVQALAESGAADEREAQPLNR